jgi:hypothetical protein
MALDYYQLPNPSRQQPAPPPVIVIDNLHDLISPYLLPEQGSSTNIPSLHLEAVISHLTIHLRYLLSHRLSSAILLLQSLSTSPPLSSHHSSREISAFLTKSLAFWSILSDSVDLSVFAHRSLSASPHPIEDNEWSYEEQILFESDVNTPSLFDSSPSSIGHPIPTLPLPLVSYRSRFSSTERNS